MAGYHRFKFIKHLLAASLALPLSAFSLCAQEDPPPAPGSEAPAPSAAAGGEDQRRDRGSDRERRQRPERADGSEDGRRGDRFANPEERRKALEKLPPEERQRLRENFGRWQKMAPEDKAAFRDMAEKRRKMVEREVDEAIKTSGLALTPDRREVFGLRYMQERRKAEIKLRDEMNERRKALVQEVVEDLKKEFAEDSTASPSPTPSAP